MHKTGKDVIKTPRLIACLFVRKFKRGMGEGLTSNEILRLPPQNDHTRHAELVSASQTDKRCKEEDTKILGH